MYLGTTHHTLSVPRHYTLNDLKPIVYLKRHIKMKKKKKVTKSIRPNLLLDLPDAVAGAIISQIRKADLFNLSQTCHKVRSLCLEHCRSITIACRHGHVRLDVLKTVTSRRVSPLKLVLYDRGGTLIQLAAASELTFGVVQSLKVGNHSCSLLLSPCKNCT